MAYAPFLWGTTLVPQWVAALFEVAALAGAFAVLLGRTRAAAQDRSTATADAAEPVSSGSW